MAQSGPRIEIPPARGGTDAVQHTPDYYVAILPGRGVYHVANDGETVCGIALHEKDRWFKRGSDKLVPPEVRLCRDCEAQFHREFALSKAHIREELAARAGFERERTGPFGKEELARLLAAFRT